MSSQRRTFPIKSAEDVLAHSGGSYLAEDVPTHSGGGYSAEDVPTHSGRGYSVEEVLAKVNQSLLNPESVTCKALSTLTLS